jgi:hypothetical protein
MNFESLNIIEPILKSLKEEGYTTSTPIQTQAIPVILAGKDLIRYRCFSTFTAAMSVRKEKTSKVLY